MGLLEMKKVNKMIKMKRQNSMLNLLILNIQEIDKQYKTNRTRINRKDEWHTYHPFNKKYHCNKDNREINLR